MDPEIRAFLIEQWVEYGVIVFLLLLRLATRIRIRGITRLQGDDYLTVLGIAIITVMSIAAMGVSSNGHNKVPQSDEERLAIVTQTPEVAEQLKVGSQWFLVGWFTYPGFMWTMKLSMLFLMKRLTENTTASVYVIPIMVYTVATYVIHAIVVATYCMPFHKYWQVYPDPGTKCYPDTLVLYIVCLTFNITTDVLIALLPVPIMIQVRMPIWKKVGTGVLLSASAFIIIASILRVHFSIHGKSGAAPAYWACRETLVAAIIVTTPVLVPLLRRSFWTRGPVSTDPSYSGGQTSSNQIPLSDRMGKARFRKQRDANDLFTEYGTTTHHIGSSSTEYINRPDDGKVHVTKNFVIDEQRVDESTSDSKRSF